MMGFIAVLLLILIFVVSSQKAREMVSSIFDGTLETTVFLVRWGIILLLIIGGCGLVYFGWGWLHQIYPKMWSLLEIIGVIIGLVCLFLFLMLIDYLKVKFKDSEISFSYVDVLLLFLVFTLVTAMVAGISDYDFSASPWLVWVCFGFGLLGSIGYICLRVYWATKKNKDRG